MATNDAGTLPWREVKKRLSGKTEKDLINIIGVCYKVSPDVKIRLSLTLSEGHEENVKIISNLKDRLLKAFWDAEKNGAPKGANLKEAKKIITLAKSSTDDPIVLLDLMLDHFQHGVEFTVKYGDMWEDYYDNIENMFIKTCEFIIKNKSQIDIDTALARIKKYVDQTEIMGWGFHENLSYFKEELEKKLSDSGGSS